MNEQTRPIESDAPRMGAVLEAAAARLARAGIDTARHDAKLLLAESAGCSLSDVDKAVLMDDAFSQFAPSPEARGAFESMLARREAREPLQHIVGHAPFRYLELEVGPGVFVPRPETELVVQEAIDWITAHGLYSPRVVDLCAGSGAIGLAIATEVPGAQVWAVELDTQAAQWTRRNMHKVGERFPDLVANYRLEVADATCPVTLATLDGTADVVISNPPYIPLTNVPQQPEVRDFDPDTALYGGSADGMMIPERIIVRAAALVRKGGLFVMEHDITQGDRTVAFARANGFTEARTHADLTGRPRYLVATR
ncbi:N5-glutamine methyltransferase family protein [Bifidobacterium pseudolongum]|uniref:peptide chain release factor N(5)-glutamine methyltransferase n=1 Tax=Bifidobacterium pseudolongum TaxID=1694 RepID=UPI0010EF0CA5|nr:SAM-dependent methyltransferase [Bifidobacterium pseudolongum subsp. globosum]